MAPTPAAAAGAMLGRIGFCTKYLINNKTSRLGYNSILKNLVRHGAATYSTKKVS